MILRFLGSALMLGAAVALCSGASAQTTEPTQAPEDASPPANQAPETQPDAAQQEQAPADSVVPPVEVIQEQPEPTPAPPRRRAVRRPTPAPTPPPPPSFAEQIAPIGAETEGTVMAPTTNVPMSPVPGADLPIGKVPSAVTVVGAQDFARQSYIETPQDILQQRVPGIVVNDVQGNVFQTNVQYRGFEASPVNGEPQGIAVYQNGVRINESFGDIVNWNLLTELAIDDIVVLSNNPVYGLNALGGAIAIQMKSGFTYQGSEIIGSGGSFDRAQAGAQIGKQSGNWAYYWAAEAIGDGGFRDFSPAELYRSYGDIGFKREGVEIHTSLTAAKSMVGVTAAAPVELLDLSWSRTFTSPQITKNEVLMPQLNASYQVNDTLTLSSVLYYRKFKQSVLDGNLSELEPCEPPEDPNNFCADGEEAVDQFGNPFVIADFAGEELGALDRTSQDANGWGASVQAVKQSMLFGRPNQFLIGTSYDRGDVNYQASSELGIFGPKFVVHGTGRFFLEPDEIAPRDIDTTNDYVGVYFLNTWDWTDRLALSAGGRWNWARIEIQDLTGEAEELNGVNKFNRFNPMVGAAYKLRPDVTLYGGYSEANRAPTPAEIACSNPDFPCLIESFLVADPPLDQVVARTVEIGLRGESVSADRQASLAWAVGLFRTATEDDIFPIFSSTAGRGVFENAADTLRQGVEANVSYSNSRWFFYSNYAFIDAVFDSATVLTTLNPLYEDEPCPAPPDDDDLFCINVVPGDRLSGIPKHRFKTGFDYWVTPKWKFGADLLAVSNQIFLGDEGGLDKPLGGYWKVDLHTSYDLTPRVQIFGLINNLFDRRYGLFGTYFNTEEADEAAEADPELVAMGFEFENPRTIVPAPPFVIYGGVKIKLQ